MIRKSIFALFVMSIVIWLFFAIFRIAGYAYILISDDLTRGLKGELPRDTSYHTMRDLGERLPESLSRGELYIFSGMSGRDFFLLRYFAYPKKVYWEAEKRWPVTENVIKIGEK